MQANKPLAQDWQQRYCIVPGHTECPYFIQFARAGSPGRHARPIPSEPASRFGPRSLILIAILVVALTALVLLAYQGGYVNQLTGTVNNEDPSPGNVAGSATPAPSPTVAQEPAPALEPTADVTITPEETGPPTSLFADPAFNAVWSRTDALVASGQVQREWIWGEAPITDGVSEPWETAPSGERLAQYFPKGRLEIEDPDADPIDPWFVTPGLLVLEMVEGSVRLGGQARDGSPGSADIPIGDEELMDDILTYAAITELGLTQQQPHVLENGTIAQTLVEGEVTTATQFATYQVTAAYFNDVPGRAHMIASVFWNYMNSQALVQVDGESQTGSLFITPFYATGFPITEPYWSTAEIAGESTDLLWQCFERRCLFYTPSNEPELRIESNDAGRHYYEWRYGPLPTPGS